MKIAFWSKQRGTGTTFNLAVTACAAVLMHPVSVAVVSGGYHDENLERKFFKTAQPACLEEEVFAESGSETELAAEPGGFFLTAGLECLLQKEHPEELTEMVVKANMRQVMKDRMYCLPASAKPEQEWWYRDRRFARMERVMNAVEACFDAVFIDCGNRTDDYARKVLREADVSVLNMSQRAETIGDFYRNPPRIYGKTFFLVGNYFAEELYNRKDLERLYRVEENRLGAIPYNPQLQEAGRMGRLEQGVERYIDHGQKGKNVEFEKELVRTTNLILKLAGVIA